MPLVIVMANIPGPQPTVHHGLLRGPRIFVVPFHHLQHSAFSAQAHVRPSTHLRPPEEQLPGLVRSQRLIFRIVDVHDFAPRVGYHQPATPHFHPPAQHPRLVQHQRRGLGQTVRLGASDSTLVLVQEFFHVGHADGGRGRHDVPDGLHVPRLDVVVVDQEQHWKFEDVEEPRTCRGN